MQTRGCSEGAFPGVKRIGMGREQALGEVTPIRKSSVHAFVAMWMPSCDAPPRITSRPCRKVMSGHAPDVLTVGVGQYEESLPDVRCADLCRAVEACCNVVAHSL